tara:strand:+ start:1284 stop:1508 length:225 start_codon:yes stop_codon:yes gene_type:complete
MDLLFILIGIGLAIFVILVSYKPISRGIEVKLEIKRNKPSEEEKTPEKLKSKNLSSEDLKKMYDDLQKKKKNDL